MQCPNCKQALRTMTYEGIQIETCDGCGGEWLDADELKHVVRAREKRFSEAERKAIAQATSYTGVKLEEVDRDLLCPKCGGTTDPINYGGGTGIILDRCAACKGFWLGADELEKVQQLVEGWEDGLGDDLEQYGPKLRKIADEMDEADDARVSRFGFVNVVINGILDVMR